MTNKKIQEALPEGWKYSTSWSGSGFNERKNYIFSNKKLGGYKKFRQSWQTQSKEIAFEKFKEWYNETYTNR